VFGNDVPPAGVPVEAVGGHAATQGSRSTLQGLRIPPAGFPVEAVGGHAATQGSRSTLKGLRIPPTGVPVEAVGGHAATQGSRSTVKGLKVLTNEKRGGLKVVAFHRYPFKLFTLRFSNKSVKTPSCKKPKTSQRTLFLSFKSLIIVYHRRMMKNLGNLQSTW
jgi:hypothetical protein